VGLAIKGRVLITGANGYLGARCVERWARTSEREVVAVWHSASDRMLADPPAPIHYERRDLSDRAQVEELFARWQVEAVVHAAALLPDIKPGFLARAVTTNIVTTANLLECAAGTGCKRFVYCSSTSVYAGVDCPPMGWKEEDLVRPSSFYALTKYSGEQCVRLYCGSTQMTGVTLRLAGIHGPGRRAGVVYHMMRAARANQPLTVNNPTDSFQLLFLDDAVDAVLLATTMPLPGSYRCINVASHVFPSMNQLAERIIELCESKSTIEVGAAKSDGKQIMNTAYMTTMLTPKHINSHLQQLYDWSNQAE
jgi:UDP-glucuronate 4-epimerase